MPTRHEEYAAWIASYVAKAPRRFVRGLCRDATTSMKIDFPELRIACGFAHVEWGADQHFWCVDPNGKIVDPTVSQFDPLGVFEYEELDLSNPADVAKIPIGKCMECGSPTYSGGFSREMCDEACTKAFENSLRI